ncbi:hypothetical protein D3C76_169720 [compost metagenome]
MDNLPALTWDDGTLQFHRKLGNFVQYFQVNLPTNGHGVPLQLINPEVIAEHLLEYEKTYDVPSSIVDEATVSIEIDDGLPLYDGVPLWERFEGEPVEHYKLFKIYREGLYTTGSRAIAKLAETTNVEGRLLTLISKTYHWQLRCRAYDLYKKFEQERRRMMEIDKLQDKHSRAAEKLLEQSLTYLEDHPEQMNPKLALQMLQVAMKAGRLSLGLSPDKPEGEAGTTQVNIQNIAGGSSAEASTPPGTSGHQLETQDIQSIFSILDRTGALKEATVIDADYSVVDE